MITAETGLELTFHFRQISKMCSTVNFRSVNGGYDKSPDKQSLPEMQFTKYYIGVLNGCLVIIRYIIIFQSSFSTFSWAFF